MPKPHTVECPKCGRTWTGYFNEPLPDKAVCKDCIAQGEGTTKGHEDRVLNPKGE